MNASIINSIAYDPSGQRMDQVELEDCRRYLDEHPQAFLWIGLHEPDAKLLSVLQAQFGLHELAIEDALCAHQRPKIEAYGDTRFIVVHTAERDDSHIVFGETYLFLGQHFLISVRHGPSHSYANMRQRVEARPRQLALGPSYPLYAIIDFIADNYVPIVDDFKETLQHLEQDIFLPQYKRGTIKRLYAVRAQARGCPRFCVTGLPSDTVAPDRSHHEQGQTPHHRRAA